MLFASDDTYLIKLNREIKSLQMLNVNCNDRKINYSIHLYSKMHWTTELDWLIIDKVWINTITKWRIIAFLLLTTFNTTDWHCYVLNILVSTLLKWWNNPLICINVSPRISASSVFPCGQTSRTPAGSSTHAARWSYPCRDTRTASCMKGRPLSWWAGKTKESPGKTKEIPGETKVSQGKTKVSPGET